MAASHTDLLLLRGAGEGPRVMCRTHREDYALAPPRSAGKETDFDLPLFSETQSEFVRRSPSFTDHLYSFGQKHLISTRILKPAQCFE